MRHALVCHPDTPCAAVSAIWVDVARIDRGLALDYRMRGDIELLHLPRAAHARRRGELWKTTCFEAFVRPDGGQGYVELNFSPSTEWAVYRFDAYRAGMAEAPLAAPGIGRREDGARVTVDMGELLPGIWHVGLSAVIEERDGTKSYWALAHPPGKPDFHHPDCFVLELPPAD